MTSLNDKVAVVTGAASGIGAASAIALAAAGARVCCADLDEAGARAVADKITSDGGHAFGLRADVAVPEDNTAMVAATADRYGAVHIAHLNAGTGYAAGVLDFPIKEWDRVLAVNLRGVFLGLQAAARAMADTGGGSIVITSSAAGLGGVAASSAYSASKHGVLGLTKSAALDLAPHGIRVNAVCPGFVASNDAIAQLAGGMAARIPVGRVGQPEDIAHLVAFLAGDNASYITGSVYSIDGGSGAGTRALGKRA
ncbi:NAD(P)-dependent dehydrogenase (short-subunit alcohol dehydrogenase family) [Kibdelosporangium banguiense]|uniref:NAD(P)-dependent dehydrogenase (Short-subunit alcohol dehydrogenase family) n=1 Tax=Kibdelosporangium banguiense TaxID=1365924 RepID=A0ABS4TUG4_9PSEU|nr:SDR family NAD(P)-dependent oxidoreductase [Kibdelosporangium banguiense]MBP2328056.1 NAD(P)-dependent dehydrogenase (short-subunit alcohol dehydrogenase family) [Kibdelosporangium banguiense]